MERGCCGKRVPGRERVSHAFILCGARTQVKGGEAVTVVYIDSVFFLNAVIDYLLCLVTARLSGVSLRRWRYALAALAGGTYAAAVFFPGCGALSAGPVKLAVGILMALIAYGGEERLFRMTLLLFALACAMAGCVLALGLLAGSAVPAVNGIFYTDVDLKVLLIAAGAADLVLTVVFRAAARHGVQGELLPVRISLGSATVELTALWDSGNSLREPGSGQAVLITAPGNLDRLMPKEVRHLLTPEALRQPSTLVEPLARTAPALRPRLLPYRAVGTGAGLLLVIRSDWVEICGKRLQGVPVALSPTALGAGYAALWGGEVRRGGRI